ncbi:MAG: S8 family serine peptidase [Acidobacteriota bacterium]
MSDSAATPEPVPPRLYEERPLWLNERLRDVDGTGVQVAVVDSGYAARPRDPRVVAGAGFVAPSEGLRLLESRDDVDRIGHGTAASEIILGLAPGARLLPLRVFGDRLETSPEVIAAAVDHAIERGVDVVNLSLGSTSPSARQPLLRACERAARAGLLVVSAAPRGAGEVYPASFDLALGVTAARFGNVFDFALGGEGEAELVAQGVRRLTWRGEAVVRRGSSVAAPHITGLIALLRQEFPGAALSMIRRLLAELAGAAGQRLGLPQPNEGG